MSRHRLGPALFLLTAALLAPAVVWPQTPLGGEFQINETIELTQDTPHLAVALDGSFAVAWRDSEGEISPFTPLVTTRFYDAQGVPLGGELRSDNHPPDFRAGPFVVNRPAGGFWVLSHSFTILDGLVALRLEDYSAQGVMRGEPSFFTPPEKAMLITNVVSTPKDRLFLAWISNQNYPAYQVKARKILPRSQAWGDEVTIGHDPLNPLYVGDVGVDGQGNAVVTWTGECGGSPEKCDAFLQRLSHSGEKLGKPIQANRFSVGLQGGTKVAVAPNGSFLVVWYSIPGYPGSSTVDVHGQLFSSSGHKLGMEFRVNAATGFPQLYPQAAADPLGNYLVIWLSQIEEGGSFRIDIRGRLFRPDGRPVGRDFVINANPLLTSLPEPRVAFGGNGTFVAVWNTSDGNFDGVYARRFAASPADEPCLVRGGRLLCDTGRRGGEAEIDLTFGGRPGEALLLGDFDGDGREDLCARYGVRFRCDLDHRGAPAEGPKVSFGLPADLPLLGDFDGDGRADPCVRRGDQFLCDTGHNGGEAEGRVTFGLSTEMPLLGDLDGDGRDDACLWSEAGFRCDTAHNGGAAEVQVAFGASGDLPVLGDFDGDGDDDPCVWRAGRFLCDTAHDGGAAEAELAFGLVGDLPLLGNLDGL